MKRLLFPVLLIVFSAFTFPAKDLTLRYTFKKGDQFEYLQTSKQTITQTIPGMGEVSTEVNMDGAMHFKVVALTSSGAKIQAQYKKLKIATKSSLITLNMDSEGPQDDTQNKITKSMMNRPFTFMLTNRGLIENVEGAENIYSGLDSLGLDDSKLAMTKQSLKQTINEESLKTSLEMGLIYYPENKIKEGDTWNNTSKISLSAPMSIENEWRLKDHQGSVALVESSGTLTTTEKDQVHTLPNGIKTKADLSGKQAITGKIDTKSGWPASINVLMEVSGKMTLLAGGMIPEDMEVPMKIKMESTNTIVKK